MKEVTLKVPEDRDYSRMMATCLEKAGNLEVAQCAIAIVDVSGKLIKFERTIDAPPIWADWAAELAEDVVMERHGSESYEDTSENGGHLAMPLNTDGGQYFGAICVITPTFDQAKEILNAAWTTF